MLGSKSIIFRPLNTIKCPAFIILEMPVKNKKYN